MKYQYWDDEKIRSQQDLPLNKNALARVSFTPQAWVESVLRTRSPEEALRFVRRLAVPMFIYKKESTKNPQAEFFTQAKNLLIKKQKGNK